jgi:cytochrome c oxidase subunit 4
MSTDTETAHVTTPHAAGHAHPSDLKYIKIAAILAVVTLGEVLTYTFDITGHLLVLILIPMMIFKFAVVAGYFMHLKFDSKLFTAMFVAGLLFALGVYLVTLTVFEFW